MGFYQDSALRPLMMVKTQFMLENVLLNKHDRSQMFGSWIKIITAAANAPEMLYFLPPAF